MRCLGFDALHERGPGTSGDKRVRAAKFQARSGLPVSAGCVVANGVRETLSSLLGAPVGMRLFEPCIPSPQAWNTLLRDARLYRVRGVVADAAIVLRAVDAAALAAMLFGEAQTAEPQERRLSPLECDVVDRVANAIAANLGTVCGARENHFVGRVPAIIGFATYFELLVTDPVVARIGIALSRDPEPESGARLDVGLLCGIRVMVRVLLHLGSTDVAAVARLAPGNVMSFSETGLPRCVLLVGGRGILRGSCGVRNGRYAVAVDARA